MTETRAVQAFDRIVFRSEGRVILTGGAEHSVVVESDDNLAGYLDTSVAGGVLSIETAGGVDIAPTEPPVFRVATPGISGIEHAGAGTVDASAIDSEQLDLVFTGVGDLTVDGLRVGQLTLDLQGVGAITMSGVADSQEGFIGGTAIYSAADLRSSAATLEVGGTADATLWVTDDLDVSVAGLAAVAYYGSPTVTQDLVGSGSLTALGPKADDGQRSTEAFAFRSGGFELAGDLYLPAGSEPHGAVVVVHGSGAQTRTSTPGFALVKTRFLEAGFAVLSWDKPGSGDSTGELSAEFELTERAKILLDAIELLGQHPSIDEGRIGVWGISQAGWVIPLALSQTDAISFAIVVSGGGEDGIEQQVYLWAQRAECAGASAAHVDLMEEHGPTALRTTDYREYREAMEILLEIPDLEAYVGVPLKIQDEAEWAPWPRNIDAFFDPMTVVRETTIPVLAVFGELDRNVDPGQGASAYEQALREAGNDESHVELIPGVGHTMQEQATGCPGDPAGATSGRYLELLDGWIDRLRAE